MGDEAHARNLIQERLGKNTKGDTCCCLTGTRTLKDRTGLGQIVGEHAWKIRMTGTRPRQRSISSNLALVACSCVNQQGGRIHGIRAHHRLPLRPFGITDTKSDRSAGGHAVADTSQDGHLVRLELLAGTTPVSEATACQCASQIIRRHMQP